MGRLLQTFTFDRNTFRKTEEESAAAVVAHIQKVDKAETLDKAASNVVGALTSYMGLFKRNAEGILIKTDLANDYLRLYSKSPADAWRWLVTRSLWLFVVPNGTGCSANVVAKGLKLSFSFFNMLLQLLIHLSTLPGEGRYLFFEELCRLLEDDENWRLTGGELFQKLVNMRKLPNKGFQSRRSFLGDLENTSTTELSEFEIPRDNFNGLFLKAFYQTGMFEFLEGDGGRKLAITIASDLDPVLQRRIRHIINNPVQWNPSTPWAEYLAQGANEFPVEVTRDASGEMGGSYVLSETSELTGLWSALIEDLDTAHLRFNKMQILRVLASLSSKRFLLLTGLSGSGKTKLAQALSRWITPRNTFLDPFFIDAEVTSDRETYKVKKADSISIEFWGSNDSKMVTKVTLPRELIGEWAEFIRQNSLTRETSAKEIRESVKLTSAFSNQLHSFDSHLKAAAFALLEASHSVSSKKCYEVVPVGADWTGIENILGYPNGLDKSAYIAKPTLELILRAESNPDVPHFLILDEMNLSHVERYFSDILSAIESDEKIHLHRDADRQSGGVIVPTEIALPKNLFVIGTVNVDETTYMFSPKVLDRANVIEFRMETTELGLFLSNPQRPNLHLLDGKGEALGTVFVEASQGPVVLPNDIVGAFDQEILLFFRVLQVHGAEFGYRVAHEAARFVHFYNLLGAHSHDSDWFPGAFDCIVVQKILPKLHGSRAKLGPLLKLLWFLCVNSPVARGEDPLHAALEASRSTVKNAEPTTEIPPGAPYPLSAEKIARMWRLLRDNGFASFAEA